MKKISSILLTTLSTIALSLSYLLSNQNRQVNKVEALESNNVIYLNVQYAIAPFYNYVYVAVHDEEGHSFASEMKRIPGLENHMLRLTIPSDYSYTTVTFWSKDDPDLDLIHAETPIVSLPTNKNNVYIIDNGEYDEHFVYQCSGHWDYYEDDLPSEGEGYYLVGSKTDWKFKNAVKLTEGTHGDKVELLNYQTIENEEFYVRSYFNDEEKIYGEKYQVGSNVRPVNIFIDNEDNLLVDDYVTPPEFTGYYISGTFSNVDKWAYSDSIKMNDGSGDNLAEYRGLEVKKGDTLRVRQFTYDSHPWDKLANISSEQDLSAFGQMSGDNFEFTVSGNYDVFAKIEEERLVFLITTHAEGFTIELTCCHYDGATLQDLEIIPSQVAYVSSEFNPVIPEYDTKGFVGIYKDEDCTIKYTPEVIRSNCRLYLKYLNDNYYCFTGRNVSGVYPKEYVLDNGVKMNNQNLPEGIEAEIYLTTEANKEYMFGLVDKDLDYIYAAASPHGGSYYGHVEYNYNTFNYIFHKAGTYHITIKGNKLDFKDASGEPFINDMSNLIKLDDKNRVVSTLESLKSIWGSQKDYFGYVEDRSKFDEIGFKFSDNPSNIYEEFMNKYYLAIYRYGSSELENFIFPDLDPVDPHLNKYTITFDPKEGTLDPTSITVEENEIIDLPTPKRKGYIFIGWIDEASGEYVFSPYLVKDDVTLIAHYKKGSPSKGCGGNIISTSIVLSTLSILGVAIVLIEKSKDIKNK